MKLKITILTTILLSFCFNVLVAVEKEITPLARLKYKGGGDWYNNPEVLPNLMKKLNKELSCGFPKKQAIVEAGSVDLYKYPFIYVTGHGKIKFTSKEKSNLRDYLLRGGFIYVDDDYGLDESFRKEISSILPNFELIELPANHEIYNCYFKFPKGLPKTHKHDDKRPRAFGIFDKNGRMMLFYTYESNISDGWADADTHNDPQDVRQEAMKFGVNLLYYVMVK